MLTSFIYGPTFGNAETVSFYLLHNVSTLNQCREVSCVTFVCKHFASQLGYGLLNYLSVFSAGRILQSAVASRTSNPQLGVPVIRTFQLPPPGVLTSETKRENCREFCRKWATSTSLSDSFTCRKFATWDRRLYFPSEGRCAESFFSRKIRRLRPGLNPRTWGTKGQHATPRPPKPLMWAMMQLISLLTKIKICTFVTPPFSGVLNEQLQKLQFLFQMLYLSMRTELRRQ